MIGRGVNPLWTDPQVDYVRLLADMLDAARLAGLRASSANGEPPLIFFRADDVGLPSRNFTRLVELFAARSIPLALAVVPGFVQPSRVSELWALLSPHRDLWTIHQHGWLHVNHEVADETGRLRKSEFGPARSHDAKRADLAKGKAKLETLFGAFFRPIFTPPWNRIDADAARLLVELGFTGLSRATGAKPALAAAHVHGLREADVCVDLHTRKEAAAQDAIQGLAEEFATGLRLTGSSKSQGPARCGVMLHHQRMNDAAFDFLQDLLGGLGRLADDGALRLGSLEAALK